MTNRQARIKRLKEAFQKVEQLMNEGYVVQWDGEVIDKIIVTDDSLVLEVSYAGFVTRHTIYDNSGMLDFAHLTVEEINADFAERLSIWKKVEIKL